MRTLHFIRHGETDMAGTFCGQSDPALNAAGRGQAEALAGQFDVVFSSDLRRAAETSEIIAGGAPIVAMCGLREINFGAWEGLRWAEIEARDAEFAARWVAEFPALTAPGGESFVDFRARVLSAVESVMADRRWETAAVVSHAGVMRVVLEELCGATDAEAWAKTKGYCSRFVYEVPA